MKNLKTVIVLVVVGAIGLHFFKSGGKNNNRKDPLNTYGASGA